MGHDQPTNRVRVTNEPGIQLDGRQKSKLNVFFQVKEIDFEML